MIYDRSEREECKCAGAMLRENENYEMRTRRSASDELSGAYARHHH